MMEWLFLVLGWVFGWWSGYMLVCYLDAREQLKKENEL